MKTLNPFFPDPLDVMRARIETQLAEQSKEDGPTRIAREIYEQRKSPTAPAWGELLPEKREALTEYLRHQSKTMEGIPCGESVYEDHHCRLEFGRRNQFRS